MHLHCAHRRFSTGAGVNSSDALIQEHYAKEVTNTIGPVSSRIRPGHGTAGTPFTRLHTHCQLLTWPHALAAAATAASRVCAVQVHLRLDTALEAGSRLPVQTYISRNLGLGRSHTLCC